MSLRPSERLGPWPVAIWLFGALLVAVLLLLDRAAPAGRGVLKITGVDTLAYYGVAQSLVWDGDVDLANQYATLGADSHWLAEVPATGRRGSPFPLGYSLYQVPFLAAARLLGALGGGDGGFGRLSYFAYFLGNIVAACLGLTFLALFLDAMAQRLGIDRRGAIAAATGTSFAIWLGTTVGYYTLSPMPHVVAFMAMSLFLALWWAARDGASLGRWTAVGLAFGFLVLCRWQALLYAAVPLTYDLFEARRWWRARRRWLLSRGTAALAALAAFLPQLFEWKAIYGRMLLVPQGPGFIELPPRYALRVLFSTHHGWFVWTPLTLVGVAGLVLLAIGGAKSAGAPPSERRALGVAFLIGVGAQVLLVGSLPTSWFNADSFSIRMLTSATPLVGAGLVALAAYGRPIRSLALAATALAIVYSLLFAAQFRLDMVPRDGRLTARELVIDKLRPRATWRRYQERRRAERAAARGDSATAARLLVGALERYGPDRGLLLELARVRERMDDAEGAAEARRRLRRIGEQTLY